MGFRARANSDLVCRPSGFEPGASTAPALRLRFGADPGRSRPCGPILPAPQGSHEQAGESFLVPASRFNATVRYPRARPSTSNTRHHAVNSLQTSTATPSR